mmetsp:Transcript_20515/g.48251  ORF Transcript_20515/g.48251 Transcript_20515/m.48251 type:complete len:241 (+) Transcript_20515:81-803(+)|eukprot:CAMPEP_0197174550 /NCGR_PEP_ID=MMETSP1423-20130617/1020_1 /TAXON_ID=476441 /ORGANISM="Pseudo-nitzschia heimii, Strain UNC1101" /LENGTH=240 /DNA_ID=CAMNT_0042623493 /DNA_START=49 /DNA_END=771 /DNA_ORIENTATION=-
MFRKQDYYGSIPTAEEDPAIVFAEAVPDDADTDVSMDDVIDDPEEQRLNSVSDVIFVDDAEAMDVLVVVENAVLEDAAVVSAFEDPETQRLISADIDYGTPSIDAPAKHDRNLAICACCDSRVAVLWINAAFLTILVLVDVFPISTDEYLLPIAVALMICGIYGSVCLKRWAVLAAACYYAVVMFFVVVENAANDRPYRAVVRFCLFSGILYAHLNLSRLMTAGIMTPQNHPKIACFRIG